MYLTYCIHTLTHNLTILNYLPSKKEAWQRLKEDMKHFMLEYKNYDNLTAVGSKKEIKKLQNGYYYKVSNKYPTRASIYERSSLIRKGYIYNTTDVKIQKILSCGVLENCTNESPFVAQSPNHDTKQVIPMPNNRCRVQFMHELKIILDKRRVSLTGSEETDEEC